MKINYRDLFKNDDEDLDIPIEDFKSDLPQKTREFFARFFMNDIDPIMDIEIGDIDINVRDDDGQTILFYYLMVEEYINLARKLVRMGVDVNAQDKCGNTVLHKKVMCTEDLNWIKEVISWKVDPLIKNNREETAYDLARKYSTPEIIEYLRQFNH